MKVHFYIIIIKRNLFQLYINVLLIGIHVRHTSNNTSLKLMKENNESRMYNLLSDIAHALYRTRVQYITQEEIFCVFRIPILREM